MALYLHLVKFYILYVLVNIYAMKKIYFFIFFLFAFFISHSQIGVGTSTPRFTLDVQKGASSAVPLGVIAPRVTADEIKNADDDYGLEQDGAIVYITDGVSSPSDKTVNMESPGYYYYDAQSEIWHPIGASVEPWMNADTKFGATSNTQNIYQSGQVGVGVSNIDKSAKFEVNSSNQGVLFPRLSTNERDAIQNPSNGLFIFNTTQSCFNYYDAVSVKWQSLCGQVQPALAAAECSQAVVYGEYRQLRPTNSNHYIELPITVTQEGSLTITGITGNGYSFSYSSPLLGVGSHVIKLLASGTPSHVQEDNVKISLNGKEEASCTVKINVKENEDPKNFSVLSLDSVNGTFIKGQKLSSSENIKVTIKNTSGAETQYIVYTNEINGMRFEAGGTLLPNEQKQITLVTTDKNIPQNAGSYQFTIMSNSTEEGTNIPVTIKVINPTIKILSYTAGSSSDTAPSTSNNDYSVNALLYNQNNFGPAGVVEVEKVVVTSAAPILANLNDKHIAIISSDITATQAADLAVFASQGGVVIFVHQTTTYTDRIFGSFYGSDLQRYATTAFNSVRSGPASNTSHPILVGPFKDIRNEYIGEDATASILVNLPAGATGLVYGTNTSSSAIGKVFSFVDDNKRLVFIGDTNVLSGNGTNTSNTTNPNKHNAGIPAVKSPYDGSPSGVNNSFLYVNTLAWAINKALGN